MKVAIVQEHVDARRGGAESSVLEMARAIARLGPDVTILHASADTTPKVVDDVTFQPIAAPGAFRALRTYRFVRGVHAYCSNARYDIVHAVTPVLCANIYQPRGGTYPETIERSVAMVRTAAGRTMRRIGKRFNVRQGFLSQIEKVLLTRRATRVIVAALSDYVRRQVVNGYGFPAERVRVVFNGVDTGSLVAANDDQRAAARKALEIPSAAPVLVLLAHNFRLKGLPELLGAMAHARRDAVRHARFAAATLLVAGRDNPAVHARRAKRLGLAGQVRFLGPVEATGSLFAAADLLVHPTWYDPCSRVVLEALASGLPVVTTRWNGAAELVDSATNGRVLDEPADAASMAAAIEAGLEPGSRAACARAADRARALVSMERHAAELIELYREVRRESAR